MGIQVAIIGCGVISKTHKAAIDADSRVELRWACDPDITKARALAPDARHSFDLAEVLLDTEVDVIHLTTPHAMHRGQLEAVIASGKHVICEKPLATTPQDIRAMVAAAAEHQANGKIAACIFQHRHGALAQRLQQLLTNGSFGTIEAAHLPFRCKRTQRYYNSAAWRGTWLVEGGGVCINQAIHSLDQFQWLLGSKPVQIKADCINRQLQDIIEVEDEAQGSITFESGLVATFDIRNDQSVAWDTRCDIRGSRGLVSFTHNDGGRLLQIEHDDPAVVNELRAIEHAIIAQEDSAQQVGKACYGNLHAVQISECYDAIEAGRQPFVTIADGAITTEIVLGIYHSAATGMAVQLPLPNDYRHPILVEEALAEST